jgi:hypothetical protein
LTELVGLHNFDLPSKPGDDSMIRSLIRVSAIVGLVAVGGLANSDASADPFPPPTQFEVNNGDGTCSTVSCNQFGCAVIDVHLCPREVGGG